MKKHLLQLFAIIIVATTGQAQVPNFIKYQSFACTNSYAKFADLNGDGLIDMIIVNSTTKLAGIYLNNNTGYKQVGSFILPTYASIVDLQDFDNDGKVDILSNSIDGNTCLNNLIRVYWNSGTGALFYATSYTELPLPSGNYCMQNASIDFNADGWIDIIATSMGGNSCTYKNNGKRNFLTAKSFQWTRDLYNYSTKDFNGDGIADFINFSKADWADRQKGSYYFRGIGDGSFQSPVINFSAANVQTGFALKAKPLSSNNYNPAIYSGATLNQKALQLGSWNQSINNFSFSTIAIPSGYQAIQGFDINGDTYEDIVCATITSQTSIMYMPNDGNGNFEKQSFVPLLQNSAYSLQQVFSDLQKNSYIYGVKSDSIIVYIKKANPNLSLSISSFNPTTASSGSTVTIKGISFTGVTAVSFGGTPAASFTVVNDSTITAMVGNGASGNMQVVTPNGTANLAGFTFNSTSSIPTNGLVAWYPFTGNTLDSSGNGNHGSNNGATLTKDRFGRVNNAYSFNGNNQRIDVADNSLLSFPNQKFTFSLWANIDSTTKGGLICKYNIYTDFEYLLRVYLSSKSMAVYIWNLGGTCAPFEGSSSLNSFYNQWHHYTYVGNGVNGGQLFIDGILVSTSPYTNCATGDGGGKLYFGMGGGWNEQAYFKGMLDDIRIYNRALDSSEIKALYNEGGYGTVLPVAITNLSAQVGNNGTQLQWHATNELNVQLYNIEASSNGVSFYTVGTIVAKGDGSNWYTYLAPSTNAIKYYRLKIVDKDGSSSYSKIVSAALGSQQTLSVYPNPAKDKVFLQFTPTVGKGRVVIRSVAGKILHNTQIDLLQGKAIIPIYNLAKGVYAVQLITNHQLQVHTLVVE